MKLPCNPPIAVVGGVQERNFLVQPLERWRPLWTQYASKSAWGRPLTIAVVHITALISQFFKSFFIF
jgi:hypothetical protein